MLYHIVNVFSLALAFTLVGLNVYISTRILNVTDLTCDASVALGGCSYGALILGGINPMVAIFIAALLGMCAGFITSSFVSYIKIEPVLASIISLSALQTLIVRLSSFGDSIVERGIFRKTILSPAAGNAVLAIIVTLILCIFVFRILNSEYGLGMRVYGNGKIISESLGINTNRILLIGLGIGNALSAVAGALMTQLTCHFSPGMGSGSLVFGLAAVIIGEKILPPKNILAAIVGCLIGSLIYKIIVEVACLGGTQDLGSEYNNIIMAIVLVLLIALIQNNEKGGTES
ncbi:MAG: hypothetical protein LBG20_02460 [Holosporaceae bacterium]|nr:hypothetical protein [Holosporaceae bacterium]